MQFGRKLPFHDEEKMLEGITLCPWFVPSSLIGHLLRTDVVKKWSLPRQEMRSRRRKKDAPTNQSFVSKGSLNKSELIAPGKGKMYVGG